MSSRSLPTSPEPTADDRLDVVLDLAHDAIVGELSPREHAQAKERLLTRLARDNALPKKAQRWPVALLLAAAAIVALWVWPGGQLEYRVEGAVVAEGGYIAPRSGDARVYFSDGSQLEISESARARIPERNQHGAHVALERGHLHLTVVPHPDNDWQVHAGPYLVKVTGTAFDVWWEPQAERIIVQMDRGSVVVRGPLAKNGVHLRAGQRLTGAPGEHLAIEQITENTATNQAPTEQSAGSATGSAVAQTAPPANAPPAASSPTPRRWSEMMADGDFDGVLTAADAQGIDGAIGSAPLGDLVALADAARYRGRSGVAGRALAALRERFAGTPAAVNASFLLGRMADDGGNPGAAINWYSLYLSEGGGPFSAEALGRKMMAQQRSGNRAGAALSAETYLQRFANGPHASAARDLVEAPEPTDAAPDDAGTSLPQPIGPPAAEDKNMPRGSTN